MRDIAIITSLFDYPSSYMPTFFNQGLRYFDTSDIHIIRNESTSSDGNYYNKLYLYKIPKVLEYLKKNILNNYCYVLFLDATDTNFIESPEGIIERFKSLNCSIVMGAEKGLWPPTNYAHLYENKRVVSESKYLNSGTYFGYTEKIIEHMEEIIDKVYQDTCDQGKWTVQYLLNDDIIVDQERDFFFSTYLSKKDVIIENNRISLNKLNACIIHDNGPLGEDTIKLINLL